MATKLFNVTDPNFCDRCGSVLPLPTVSSTKVECKKCHNTLDISGELDIVFHVIGHHAFIIHNPMMTQRILNCFLGMQLLVEVTCCSNGGNVVVVVIGLVVLITLVSISYGYYLCLCSFPWFRNYKDNYI